MKTNAKIIPWSMNQAIIACVILWCCVDMASAWNKTYLDEQLLDAHEYVYDCKKMAWSIAKRVLSQFRQCSLALKSEIPDDKERAKYIQCNVKCTLTKMELINEKGRIGPEGIHNFLNRIIKPQFHVVADIVMGGCIEEFNVVPEETLKDQYCNAFGDLLKCLQDQVGTVC